MRLAAPPTRETRFLSANGGDDGHWRGTVFGNELMASNVDAQYPYFLSAITIQSLADLGYKVDPSQADPYTLP